MQEVVLQEWGRATAAEVPALAGHWPDDPAIAADLARLPGDALRATGGRHGLDLEAGQHVGVVRLGPLQVRIRPKLPPGDLWLAVRWALGLDDLQELPDADQVLDGDFVELLCSLLLAEAHRLWDQGVHRGYVAREEWRASPRGRPDLAVLARHQPLTRAALPCRSHELSADVPTNQLVVAGLDLARRLARGLHLRGALHRSWTWWAQACGPARLDPALLAAARRAESRLTARYQGAHAIVRLLAAGQGMGELDTPDGPAHRLPGFLWNMSGLWEDFLHRFLDAFLPDPVRAQHGLPHLYRVQRAPPGGWSAPQPRPDLVVYRQGRPALVIDAKYRDILARGLPRDILYQLSVYALAWSRDQQPVPALALCPTLGEPGELALALHGAGAVPRQVVVRGVRWDRALAALRVRGAEGARVCGEVAKGWVGEVV